MILTQQAEQKKRRKDYPPPAQKHQREERASALPNTIYWYLENSTTHIRHWSVLMSSWLGNATTEYLYSVSFKLKLIISSTQTSSCYIHYNTGEKKKTTNETTE